MDYTSNFKEEKIEKPKEHNEMDNCEDSVMDFLLDSENDCKFPLFYVNRLNIGKLFL